MLGILFFCLTDKSSEQLPTASLNLTTTHQSKARRLFIISAMLNCMWTATQAWQIIAEIKYILPSGHVERHDCYPRVRWRVTSFYFFLHDVLRVRLSAGLAHLSLQEYWQLDAGFLGLKLQTNQQTGPNPRIFRTTRQLQTDRSFRYPLCFLA
jgi:hypothetical protein